MISKTHAALREHDRVICVAPCGAGKRICAAWWAAEIVSRRKKLMVVTNRRILIHQMQEELKQRGIRSGVLMASEERDELAPVQVASIQTLKRRKYKDLPPCDWVIVDESHLHSKAYGELFSHLNKNVKVVGLTATPVGPGGLSLSGLFDTSVEGVTNRELISGNWLLPTQVWAPSEPDIEGVEISNSTGEYNQKQLGKAVETCTVFADVFNYWSPYSDMQTIVFTPRVKHAEALCRQFQARGFRSAVIIGETLKKERQRILAQFESGDLQVLCAVNVLCLDSETEILTASGWKGIDELESSDLVANWNTDEEIFFDTPKNIVRRNRKPDEAMVSFKGKTADFRVTDNHTIVKWNPYKKAYKTCRAREIVGKASQLPTCGQIKKAGFTVFSGPRIAAKGRFLSQNSYSYRKKGIPSDEARALAESMYNIASSRSRKSPGDLTLDECRFIGFFLGDGSCYRSRSGGNVYTASQSTAYPHIVSWIERVISLIGLSYRRYVVPPSCEKSKESIKWDFPRGTGGHLQYIENGIYKYEPYLKKTRNLLLWCLSKAQFDALIEGFWYADGKHGEGTKFPPPSRSIYISNSNKEMLDQIQAVATCNGYTAAIMKETKRKNKNHRQVYTLRLRADGVKLHAGCGHSNDVRLEGDWRRERVWCVESTSGFIITRRNGKVCVLGNSVGFDAPIAQCAIDLQPNNQFRDYWQKIGRIKRLHPDQDYAVWLDFAGNYWRHLHPDDDPPWSDLTKNKSVNDVIDAAKKKDKNRDRKSCPHCGYVPTPLDRLSDICPSCGKSIKKHFRKVRMKDGTMKKIGFGSEKGQNKPKSSKNFNQQQWDRARYIALNRGGSMKMARVLYYRATGKWPNGKHLSKCPENYNDQEWQLKVEDYHEYLRADARIAKDYQGRLEYD